MKKLIVVMGYPATFSFTTLEDFPPFEYGCEVRRKLLVKELEKQKIPSPCHGYEEYVVETIEQGDGWEQWHLGS